MTSISSPKVILIGGSNLAFGVDSKKIGDSLKMPVVNMAIGAAFGLEFDINQIRKHLAPGDIVIVSEFPSAPNYQAIFKTLFYEPSAINGIRTPLQYYKLFKAGILESVLSIQSTVLNGKKINFVLNKNQTISDSTSVYFSKGFNQYGDLISHLNNIKPKQLNDRGGFTTHYEREISLLNNFKKLADEKLAKVYYINPPYPISEFKKNKSLFMSYQKYLRKNLKVKILGSFYESVFPDSLFFDTVNHLDSMGRTKRTEVLISLLRKEIKQKN
ncbi:hypothetical protein [Pedobacter sp. BMA]|uniref:hypothetical protein n=1 Tax=Pedobacter sp. BMA TaxID=1663685 RepID=UPI0012E0540A|nr:hypothetical protein [Pedobacter sp. BMA]